MKRVALIGMPNTGKSTLFNKISGSSAKVGNWPGVTVDLLSVKTMFGGELIELIDLPGIYGLSGYSEDEKVVADFIKNNQIDHIFYVANSTQLDRQLELMLELKKFNIPLTLVANMIDEAKAFGIEIDFKVLEQCLQTEIIPMSAKYGQGFEKLHQKPKKNLPQKKQIIELDQVVKKTIHYPARLNNQNTKKLDALFLNPAFGLPIFLFIIFGVFQFVFSAGQPIQEWMSNFFFLIQENYLIPLLSPLNSMLQSFIIDGVYAGLTTVAAFVPIIILFFFIMTIIEDSGYFSRAAFLMDKIMEKMGLDGRAFVMMLMGFGCNVPALMGTKIMRTKEIRFLTMLVIPFSLCSARLQVFLFLIAAFFSPTHGALVLFSLYLLSFFSIFITAIIFKNKYQSNEPLEIGRAHV